MTSITALTSGKFSPASRFRVRQFIPYLLKEGFNVNEYYPAIDRYTIPFNRLFRVPNAITKLACNVPGIIASHKTKITWVQRELYPGKITLEKFVGGIKIFDIDDAIWFNATQDNFFEKMLKSFDGFIVGNDYLAEPILKKGLPVWTIPTCIDTSQWKKGTFGQKRWAVGWTGTFTNLDYLYSIEDALHCFLEKNKDCLLKVMCDKKPLFKKINENNLEYIEWSEEKEIGFLQNINIGIMPLKDNKWSRGKCSFKMLQYMAVGIPVIVSPVGMNIDVLSKGSVGFSATTKNDWVDALEALYGSETQALEMGAEGREVVLQYYSVLNNTSKIANVFKHFTE